ncbi:hypothetical protein PtA15_3A796 [Puccinia triticina]|uniref:Aminoacyl-tRNA synthetase class II (D/K/N) domain-containing protein n=1 Tax=Puccinia triticina TaxID=208348 RepID=A0ABY7CGZ5_9BASI|nr:uncharacterized protein PtA15_3A796 [Puccinia triticina]WAQ83426.1 hypothetical protein PtA15_3A796 [Puccinia triticina]
MVPAPDTGQPSDLQGAIAHNKGFIEIHTPKIQGAATESGTRVFKLGYFEQTAFLAQSLQLAKQMAIAADFERFIGLDLEMAINKHYHEAVDLLNRLFLSIFRGLQASSAPEIQTIKSQHPLDDFTFLEQTLCQGGRPDPHRQRH